MDINVGAALVRDGSAVALPREVQRLLRREREVATIVYDLGAATALDVQARLSMPLANASVRSMLNRLVAKGVLTRFLSGRKFWYLPALSLADSRRRALMRFVEDHFAGSINAAALAMQEMLADSSISIDRSQSAGRKEDEELNALDVSGREPYGQLIE